MKVLLGEGTGGYIEPLIRRYGWGRMWIARDRNIYTYPGEPWGLDNGAYKDWVHGRSFDESAWLRVVDKAEAVPEKPYLAVLPDIVGGGVESLDFSLSWVDRLPDFPWYLALQDGMDPDDVLPVWLEKRIKGLFLGGTNAFKAEAGFWSEFAHLYGWKFHYGRVGTLNKVAHAMEVEADSIDSAGPMWERTKMRAFVEQVTQGPIQKDLFWDVT